MRKLLCAILATAAAGGCATHRQAKAEREAFWNSLDQEIAQINELYGPCVNTRRRTLANDTILRAELQTKHPLFVYTTLKKSMENTKCYLNMMKQSDLRVVKEDLHWVFYLTESTTPKSEKNVKSYPIQLVFE